MAFFEISGIDFGAAFVEDEKTAVSEIISLNTVK